MASLTHKKISLFSTPEGSVLVHACNAKGVWGSGIALDFRKLFPNAYKRYSEYCKSIGSIGTAPVLGDNGYFIACLITSSGFGGTVDDQDTILVNTTLALNMFCSNEHWRHYGKRTIYSNKFNSGLFGVPWKETEKILKVLVKRYDLNWVVCDPSMKKDEVKIPLD